MVAPISPAPKGRQVCRLTPGHHDVRHTHRGLDILVEGGLDKLVILFDDTLNVAAPLTDVAAQPPYQADVRVCVNKDLHVQELDGERGLAERDPSRASTDDTGTSSGPHAGPGADQAHSTLQVWPAVCVVWMWACGACTCVLGPVCQGLRSKGISQTRAAEAE